MKTAVFACLAVLIALPAFAESPACREDIGVRAATILVDDCTMFTPATHPPCNMDNSCSLILSEIVRSCELAPDIKGCKAYLQNEKLLTRIKTDNAERFPDYKPTPSQDAKDSWWKKWFN